MLFVDRCRRSTGRSSRWARRDRIAVRPVVVEVVHLGCRVSMHCCLPWASLVRLLACMSFYRLNGSYLVEEAALVGAEAGHSFHTAVVVVVPVPMSAYPSLLYPHRLDADISNTHLVVSVLLWWGRRLPVVVVLRLSVSLLWWSSSCQLLSSFKPQRTHGAP